MASKNKNIALLFGAGLIGLYLITRKKETTPGTGISPKNNKQHLDSLHPQYKERFTRLINLLQRAGYIVQINSSYRNFAKQKQLKKLDERNASPGFSAHNYGMAIDLQLKKGKQILNKDSPPADWIKTGIIKAAKTYGLSWGGTIKGYYDPVHFQVENINTSKLYNLALNQFKGKSIENIPGNQIKLV